MPLYEVMEKIFMSKKLVMLLDGVLVRPSESGSGNGFGIQLPEKQKPTEGIVLEVGPGALSSDGKLIPMSVRKDCRVIYRKWAGTEVKFNGEDLMVMKESDIIGIIEE